MNSPQPLHPNIARMAARYDEIVTRFNHNQLSAAAAMNEISQLEARDDTGVRWCMDPNTGQFMRKTFNGELEYDTPPSIGVQTPDAFSYTSNPKALNPNDHIDLVEDRHLSLPPTQLAGATRNDPNTRVRPEFSSTAVDKVMSMSMRTKAIALAIIFVLVLIIVNLL